MLNKLITSLIIITMIGGLFILIRGLAIMDFHNQSGDPLSIAGAILFASGLIALSIQANRSK